MFDIKDLIELCEQMYVQCQREDGEFRYEVIKSKYPASVGAKVNNIVVDNFFKGRYTNFSTN